MPNPWPTQPLPNLPSNHKKKKKEKKKKKKETTAIKIGLAWILGLGFIREGGRDIEQRERDRESREMVGGSEQEWETRKKDKEMRKTEKLEEKKRAPPK